MDICKRGRGSEVGATEKQIQEVIRVGFEPGNAGLQVQHSDHSATLPPQKRRKITAAKFITRKYDMDL